MLLHSQRSPQEEAEHLLQSPFVLAPGLLSLLLKINYQKGRAAACLFLSHRKPWCCFPFVFNLINQAKHLTAHLPVTPACRRFVFCLAQEQWSRQKGMAHVGCWPEGHEVKKPLQLTPVWGKPQQAAALRGSWSSNYETPPKKLEMEKICPPSPPVAIFHGCPSRLKMIHRSQQHCELLKHRLTSSSKQSAETKSQELQYLCKLQL